MIKIYDVIILLSIHFVDVFSNDDKHDLYSMLSSDQHEGTPRLEDFFWTGSGDGPPPPAEPPPLSPSQPSPPLVRTTTVLATVYLDSYPPQAVTDKTTGECVLNCADSVPGSLEPEIPDDRRYWLLTVIQGSTPDSLQLRLARLYQKAFLRQQERHLGIIKSLDAPTTRKKHEVHSFLVNKDSKVDPSDFNNPLRYDSVNTISNIQPTHTLTNIMKTALLNASESNVVDALPSSMFPVYVNKSSNIEIKPTKLSELKWVLVTPTIMKREVTDREELLEEDKEEIIDIPLETDGNETFLFKREIIKPEQQPPVQVHIQNITESSETGSVQIVYVVMVGGRAVPAAVAARDMRLVRDAEVAKELGAVVTTKAEPAYLKAAEGLAGEATASTGVQGAELWALAVGSAIALILVLVSIALLCRLVRRKKKMSAASLRAYRNELMREAERNQLKQVHEEKDGRLISVVSPSRTRPSSTLLPVFRAASASSSTSSSGVSEVEAAIRRRQKKPGGLRIAQKRRVGTTDSLLEAAGIDSSDSAKELSVPNTPTSYLSMPSVRSFPRGNTVEPLSKVLEPISVRHLDVSPPCSPVGGVPRRQMASQLVRLGSIDKDPGVIGPLVWDLHCQRIKDCADRPSPAREGSGGGGGRGGDGGGGGVARMRHRFNQLMDDACTLFNTPAQSLAADHKGTEVFAQARNDNVKLPGSPYSALDTVRGKSAGFSRSSVPKSCAESSETLRPRTSALPSTSPAPAPPRPQRAWDRTLPHSISGTPRVPPTPTVNPAFVLAEGRLPAEDPALPLISAIKTEIQRVRDNALANK